MPRFFTLPEAEQLLPQIEQKMRQALDLYAAHREADSKLEGATRRITMLGGSIVDRDEIVEWKERRDTTATEVRALIEEIHSFGCQIKDLSIGLIDFPTLYRGTEVLLCWRFGEAGIGFWHGLDEGFQGRRPLDADFRENHRGDPVH